MASHHTRSKAGRERCFRLALSMLVALLVLLAAGADLDGAQKAYADVDYQRCRDRAQSALLVPATVSERVIAWRLLGLCAAATNDTDTAREAFRMMLAIDAAARLPDGLSPRFTSSFREAKGSWVGATPLALTLKQEAIENGTRTVTIAVADAAELVARLQWRAAGGTEGKAVKAAALVEFELPAGPEIMIVALDKAGGEVSLLTLPSSSATAVNPLDPTTQPPAANSTDDGAIWPFVIGGVAGGLVVVGGATALVVVLLSPPTSVTLKTDVGFADR